MAPEGVDPADFVNDWLDQFEIADGSVDGFPVTHDPGRVCDRGRPWYPLNVQVHHVGTLYGLSPRAGWLIRLS
jgi:hypothetical protein